MHLRRPFLALTAALLVAASGVPAAPVSPTADRGVTCTSGCALEPPAPIRRDEIESHLAAVAAAPPGAPTEALESLLFYADATREHLDRYGAGPLDGERAELLRRELRRTHVRVAMRLVDASGTIRGRLDEKVVPLGVKSHLVFDRVEGLQPFEANGTVARVGLGHIWARY